MPTTKSNGEFEEEGRNQEMAAERLLWLQKKQKMKITKNNK
jgi:hypothetical protein